MAFPDDPRDLSVAFAFGDTWRTASPTFTDVSPGTDPDDPGPVRGEATITRGRIGDAPSTDPTRVEGLSVSNADGEYSPANVTGSHYGELVSGVPVQVSVDVGAGAVPLATYFADDFVPAWDGPAINERVNVSGMGVLERINRLRDVRSALAMSILGLAETVRPTDYWPMEDGPQAGQFNSALQGRPAMSVTDASLASVDDLPGSAPLALFTATTAIRAPISGLPQPYSPSPAVWVVAWMAKFDTLPGADTTIMKVLTSGGDYASWVVSLNGTTLTLNTYSAAGVLVVSSPALSPIAAGEWLSFYLFCGSSAFSDFGLRVHNDQGSLVSLAGFSGIADVGVPTEFVVPASANLVDMSMGHALTSSLPTVPDYLSQSPNALSGYNGETAANRISRVCAALGVTATIVNASGETADDDLVLGPQPVGTAIAVLRDAEDGGEGVLDETTDGKPRYTTNHALLNMTPIELDFTTHVADLIPLGIERDLRGAVTVANDDTSAVVTNDDDPTAPAASLYRNVATSALIHHAGWLGSIGFLRQPRFVVVLDLRANADMLALMPSDLDLTNRRIQITGAPTSMVGPDALDLLVVGTHQSVGADRWRLECLCEPYRPYLVGEYGHATDPNGTGTDRYDTAGCVTFAGLRLPGSGGSYASTPDTTDADVSSTITVRLDCALADWTPSASQALMAKYDTGTNQRSWALELTTAGKLAWLWSTDGTSGTVTTATSTESVTAANGGRMAVKVAFDLNSGGVWRARFYYIDGGSDDLSDSAPWVQLGTTVTGGAATTIFNSTTSVTVGARGSTGGTNATTGVIRQAAASADSDVAASFYAQATGTTSFSQSGETWTVSGSGAIYNAFTAGTDTSMLVYTTLGQPWAVDADDLPMEVRVSGAVLNVTAVTGTDLLTQLFTVDAAAVNDVAKTITAGEAVSLAQPAVYAL